MGGLMETFSTGGKKTCMGVPPDAKDWGLEIPLGYFLSAINYIGLSLVVLFVLVLLLYLCCCHQARGLGQGHYISYTYSVQASCPYKFMACMIAVFVLLVFADTIRFMFALYDAGHTATLWGFIKGLFLTLATLTTVL